MGRTLDLAQSSMTNLHTVLYIKPSAAKIVFPIFKEGQSIAIYYQFFTVEHST
jgi:hypothetical protein